jgi:hypothetical protein
MTDYPATGVERAMKVQEVILRAMAKSITWWPAGADLSFQVCASGPTFHPIRSISRTAWALRRFKSFIISGVASAGQGWKSRWKCSGMRKLREFGDGKGGHAAVGAGGDKLQLAGFKMACVDRHSCGVSEGEARRLSRTSVVCPSWRRPERKGLRQPARRLVVWIMVIGWRRGHQEGCGQRFLIAPFPATIQPICIPLPKA